MFFLKQIKEKTSKRTQRLTKNYRVIAVMFNNQKYDEYYEKVKITWIHKTTIENLSGKITKLAKIDLFIPRFGFIQNKTSAIYISCKANSTYRIHGEPTIRNWAKTGNPKYKIILDSIRHKVYRIEGTDQPQLIQITIMIGMPNTIRHWSSVGVIAGMIIPSIMLVSIIYTQKIPPFAFESSTVVIALLIGERVLILKDITLMKGWSHVNLILVFWTLFVLIIIIMSPNWIHDTSECKMDLCSVSSSLNNLVKTILDLNDVLKEIKSTGLIQSNNVSMYDIQVSDVAIFNDTATHSLTNDTTITPTSLIP